MTLNFSFVKDIFVVGEKIIRKGQKTFIYRSQILMISLIQLDFPSKNNIFTKLSLISFQVQKFVNVLPQRGWIQSVLNERDPDLKIWPNDNPSNFRNENNSSWQNIYSTPMDTFLILCIFLI